MLTNHLNEFKKTTIPDEPYTWFYTLPFGRCTFNRRLCYNIVVTLFYLHLTYKHFKMVEYVLLCFLRKKRE